MKTLLLLSLLSLPHSRADWVNWGAGALDAGQTIQFLHAGAREGYLPTQSAPGIVALVMGAKAGETIIAHKCHRRVCRALPWVAAAGSAFTAGYSLSQPNVRHHGRYQ